MLELYHVIKFTRLSPVICCSSAWGEPGKKLGCMTLLCKPGSGGIYMCLFRTFSYRMFRDFHSGK